MRYLPFILLLALVVYALVDCIRSEGTDMPVGLPKALWLILIVVFPGAGAIAWLVVSRVTRQANRAPRGARGSSGFPSRPVRRTPPRPVAPDDDPDFLASLDRREPQTPEPETSPEPVADDEDGSTESADNDDDGSTRP